MRKSFYFIAAFVGLCLAGGALYFCKQPADTFGVPTHSKSEPTVEENKDGEGGREKAAVDSAVLENRAKELREKLEKIFGEEAEDYAVYVRFLRDKANEPFLYRDRPMRSASMIKVFILDKAMRDFEAGRLDLDERVTLLAHDKVGGSGVLQGWADGEQISINELLRLMIIESDNTATNIMIDRLGMGAIDQYIRKEGYQATSLRRKMMDFEAARRGEENMTSAGDLGEFFSRLYYQENVSARSAEIMTDFLLGQTDGECLPEALPGVAIAHKTGELSGLFHDGGIVFGKEGDIVLCILSDDTEDREDNINRMKLAAQAIMEIKREK